MRVKKQAIALVLLATLILSVFSPVIYALDLSGETVEVGGTTDLEGSSEITEDNVLPPSSEPLVDDSSTSLSESKVEEPSTQTVENAVSTQSIAIGEDEVTKVVEQTIDLSFYDLLGGFTETLGDSSDKYKVISTSDNSGKVYLQRNLWEKSYENSDKTIHQQLDSSTIYLTFTDSESEQGENDVVGFDKSSFYIYDFSQDISDTFTSYLKVGNDLIEYQITLNYQGQKQTIDKSFSPTFSSATNNQKQTSSDGYLSFTADYANRKFTITSEQTGWLVYKDSWENGASSLSDQAVYLEQAKASYEYYLYNPTTKVVKIYRLTVTNTVTETPEETITINLNKNNQWPAGTEVYQNGAINTDLQVVGGYESGYSPRFRLDWKVGSYSPSGTFYFGLSGEDQTKNSFVEYAVWKDENKEEHLIKIVANLDEKTPETVQSKIFNHTFTKAELTDTVKKVESKYNDNRTATDYIIYDAAGNYTDYSGNSTQGQYILLRADSTIEGSYDFYEYLTEVEENTFEKWYYYPDEGVQRYHITGDDSKATETINISADLDDFENITTKSTDNNIIFSTTHIGDNQYFSNYYYLDYAYDYDGIYQYVAKDWQYNVKDEGNDTIALTQKVYQIRDYGDYHKIEKVYTVNYTLQARTYEQKTAIDVSVSQANNYDYFEHKVVKSADNALTLRAYYTESDSDSGDNYRYHYENYYVQLDSNLLGEDLLTSSDLPYKSTSKSYTDNVLDWESEDGHDTGAVYVYNKKEKTYAKYPVNLTVDDKKVAPDTLTKKNISVTVNLSDLLTTNIYGYGDYSKSYQDDKAGNIFLNLHCDKYKLRSGYTDETPDLDRIFLGYDITGTKTSDNTYTFQYLAGVKVAVTVENDLAKNPEVLVSKLSSTEKTITVAKGSGIWFLDNITVSPENATVKYVKFEVADETVIEGSSYYFEAKKIGATEVTATSVNGKKTTFTVVVKNQVSEPYNPVAEVTDSGEDGTGIRVAADSANVIPIGATLAVTPITDEVEKDVLSAVDTLTEGQFKLFDIKLINKDNAGVEQTVQPNGRVTVYIPIPEGFNKDKLVIYHFDENTSTRTKISGWVETIDETDYFAFYTDHFSYYVLEEVDGEKEEPTDSSSSSSSSSEPITSDSSSSSSSSSEPVTSDSSSSSSSSSEPVTSESSSSSSSSSEPITSDSSSSSSSSSEPVTSGSSSSSSSSSEPVTSDSSSPEPVTSEKTVTNSATGIKVSGNIPDGALLSAEKINSTNNPNYLAVGQLLSGRFELFEIHLVKDGKIIQPNGKVKVYLPIPADFNASQLKVYYFNENSKKNQLLNGSVEGNFYVFETDHFSYYALEEVNSNKKATVDLPSTGTQTPLRIFILGVMITLLALAFVTLRAKQDTIND